MIAVDTSAIIAIAFAEPERELFLNKILSANQALICAPSIVETRIVIRAKSNNAALNFIDELLALPIFEIVAADKLIADLAFNAYVNYGKGSGHPAQLNFGDVFSYALAKSRDIPLLFKGTDFSKTDVLVANL